MLDDARSDRLGAFQDMQCHRVARCAWSSIVYRYIDWSITILLQMGEFYLILAAVQHHTDAGKVKMYYPNLDDFKMWVSIRVTVSLNRSYRSFAVERYTLESVLDVAHILTD